MSILQMSISAGVFVIVIVLIRAVALNRLPKKMFLVLWGVALFRLLIPVSIPLPLKAPNIIDEVTRMLLPNIATLVNENPLSSDSIVTGIPGIGTTEAAQEQFLSITPITAIWLVGLIALFIFFSVIYFRNRRIIRYATEIHDHDYLNVWLTENRLSRPIVIMQSDRIETPLAAGILKPRIIMPKSMDLGDKQLLNYVLTHEYFHIKRHDAVWKMAMLLALCVHWFNPMVWLMFILASRDLELTCDEAVICRFGVEKKQAYAYMLISMAEQQGKFAPLYNGFSRNATEERIVSIIKMKKTSIVGILVALVIVIGTGTVFLTSALSAENEPGNTVDSNIPENSNMQEYIPPENYTWEDGPIEVDSSIGKLGSVNRNDEQNFTAEEWADILEKVEMGEILFFETVDEEREYWQNGTTN